MLQTCSLMPSKPSDIFCFISSNIFVFSTAAGFSTTSLLWGCCDTGIRFQLSPTFVFVQNQKHICWNTDVIFLLLSIFAQCGQSSPSQRWGADLRAHYSVKFPMTLKMGLERSQLFPEIFEIVLRPFWWAAGSEQPSPPLHRAAAARLLRRSCVLQQYFFTPHIICISQCFANHISDGRRVWRTEL